MTGNTPLKLISMSEINAEEVQWLWYPYIPLGKLTILQGDPGEGKTSFILAVIAALTRGDPLPECEQAAEPMNVIYQTAEDGLADTIKPRLESAGADCTRVLVIDEGKRELTLCDARLEEAIRRTAAKLIVLDPLQAYLGSNVDMHRANEVRPVLKRLSLMAERTQCAVILIGHMNKAQGLKSGYRGLGSIDFRASARSVLIVGRLKSGDTLRIVAQDKNSLAPEGAAIAFELHPEHGFQWKGFCDATVDNILNGTGQVQTKTMQMEDELRRFLTQPRPAEEVLALAKQLGISERTLKIAKRNLGILSERRADQWLWRLPEQEGRGNALNGLHPCTLPQRAPFAAVRRVSLAVSDSECVRGATGKANVAPTCGQREKMQVQYGSPAQRIPASAGKILPFGEEPASHLAGRRHTGSRQMPQIGQKPIPTLQMEYRYAGAYRM